MEVYQAEGMYACYVPFSGPIDNKLNKEERQALFAIKEELTRTHDRWLSIEDNPPPKIGWYAVIRRFRDRPDRFPPGSGYWDGTSWDHGHIYRPITAGLWEPKLCGVLGLCTPMAWLTSICYNAGEGSLVFEGDKNVAKKEERTHAGS